MNRRLFLKFVIASIAVKFPFQTNAAYSDKKSEMVSLKKKNLNRPEIINFLLSKGVKKSFFKKERNSLQLKIKVNTDVNKTTLIAVSSSSFCQNYINKNVSGIIMHSVERDKTNNMFNCIINRNVAKTNYFKNWQSLYLIILENNETYISEIKLQNFDVESGASKIAKGNIIEKSFSEDSNMNLKIQKSINRLGIELI